MHMDVKKILLVVAIILMLSFTIIGAIAVFDNKTLLENEIIRLRVDQGKNGFQDVPRDWSACLNKTNHDGSINIHCYPPISEWVCSEGQGQYECEQMKCRVIQQIKSLPAANCGEINNTRYFYEADGSITQNTPQNRGRR